MWLQRKAQYIRNQIAKDYNLEGDYERIGYIMGSLTDELYHKYEERYYKYLMKHIHPIQPNLHCSAPQLDTRCTCAKCTAKYEVMPEETPSEKYRRILEMRGD